MRVLPLVFIASLAIATLAIFTQSAMAGRTARSARAEKWLPRFEDKNDSENCASLLKTIRDYVAGLMDNPNEAGFLVQTSLSLNTNLKSFMANGPAPDSNWANTGLVFRQVDDGIQLLKNGVEIRYFTLHEPISDIRFITDHELFGGSRGKGYLSVVGWTRTHFFRLDGYNLKNLSSAQYDLAVGQISAISASDSVRQKEGDLVTVKEPAAMAAIPSLVELLGERGATQESRLLHQLGQNQRFPSLLNYAIGNLADLIMTNVELSGRPNPHLNWNSEGYPSTLLRLAADALLQDVRLRGLVAYLLTVEASDGQAQFIDVAQNPSEIKGPEYAFSEASQTDPDIQTPWKRAFFVEHLMTGRLMVISIAADPLHSKDFIKIDSKQDQD